MPQYELRCKECGHEDIKICSYEKAQEIECEKCGKLMEIVPSLVGGVKVNGFSEANGYNREELSYDGSNRKW